MHTNTKKKTPALPEFGRVSEIAKGLGVSKNTIWRLARESEKTQFPKSIKLTEKVTVWRWADVNAWVNSKEAA